MHPDTAVVVVNWNNLPHTRACLASLDVVRAEWSDCIVVDNGSSDGSGETLEREFPWARVVRAERNLGYAGGNNLGVQTALESGAGAFLILNNDATLAPGAITALREAAADPAIAIAGPLVHRAGGDRGFWYAGGRLTRDPFRARELTDAAIARSPGPVDVDYVPGCALLACRELVERIGLLDERFFLTWEDADWSTRAIESGLRCVAVPTARVWHVGSSSFERTFSALYSYYFFRNMMLFARLHFPPPERHRAYLEAAGYARAMFHVFRKSGSAWPMAAGAALGFVHFTAGRFGAAPAFLTNRSLRRRAGSEA